MRFPAALVLILAHMAFPALAGGLRPFTSESLDVIRAENAERPFALVFWSIHCAPCIAEMGLWKAALASRPDARLILVSTDRPSDTARAIRTLDDQGMDGEAWIFADGNPTRLRFAVDPRWRGELPRSYLYARDGRLVASITGEPSEGDLNGWEPPR